MPGHLTRGDILLYLLLFCLTAAAFLLCMPGADPPAGTEAVIRTDSGTAVYPLDRDCTFTVESAGQTLHLRIADGKLSVTESTCRNQLCVARGEIFRPGEVLICLPAHVIVTVRGPAKGGDADVIIG